MPGGDSRNRALPGYALGGLLCLVCAELLLFFRLPGVQDLFYLLAWWPYILLADGLVYKKTGWSIIKSRPGAFLDLLPWSVSFWLIFELFNLRLSNWHYVGLIPQAPLRWTGYAAAFATVLPGLFETYLLIRAYTPLGRLRTRPLPGIGSPEKALFFSGILFLALPLLLPRFFYPLVWGGFVLVLEPFNRKRHATSLLEDLQTGRAGRIASLLASGLACGFLWEFWNYWARSKWVYTVPFVGDLKLFEMPVAGFLGFPPFALECYAMYAFVASLGLASHWDPESPQGRTRFNRLSMVGLHLVFWGVCFWLIDSRTVWSLGDTRWFLECDTLHP